MSDVLRDGTLQSLDRSATRGAGRIVIIAGAGVAIDAALDTALCAALERGAGLAGAAVLDAGLLDLGTVFVPERGGFRARPVRRTALAVPTDDVRVDVPAGGAVAVRRTDLHAIIELHARASGGDGLVLALARMMAAAGRATVCAARAIADRPTAPDAIVAPADWLPCADRRTLARANGRRDGVAVDVVPHPRTTVLVFGAHERRATALQAARATRAPLDAVTWTDDAAHDLERALAPRGDRYVALIDAAQPLAEGWLEAAIDDLEGFGECAAVVDGGLLLVAPRALPGHVRVPNVAAAELTGAVTEALAASGRSTRDRRTGMSRVRGRGRLATPTIGCVFLATGRPAVVRATFDALIAAVPMATEIVAVVHGDAAVAQRMVRTYPHIHVEIDHADPLMGDATNRALARVRTDIVVLASDEVSVLPGLGAALLRAAIARPDVGAFGVRLGSEDPVHAPPGLQSYPDEFAMRRYADARARSERGRVSEIDVLRLLPVAFDRRALDCAGGLVPELAATSSGIEDVTIRMRSAGYAVAIAEDIFAHRYAADESRSVLLAPAVAAAIVRRRYGSNDVGAIVRSGWSPERDQVPVRPAPVAPAAPRVVIACAVGSESEWEIALTVVRRALDLWSARDPVAVAVGVDGAFAAADVVRRVRDVLLRAERPLADAPAVRIGRVADGDWSRLLADAEVAVGGAPRAALAAYPVLDSTAPAVLRALAARAAGAR